jgi:hypothetical protein
MFIPGGNVDNVEASALTLAGIEGGGAVSLSTNPSRTVSAHEPKSSV